MRGRVAVLGGGVEGAVEVLEGRADLLGVGDWAEPARVRVRRRSVERRVELCWTMTSLLSLRIRKNAANVSFGRQMRVGYITRASFSSSCCMQLTEQLTNSMREAAVRASLLETP